MQFQLVSKILVTFLQSSYLSLVKASSGNDKKTGRLKSSPYSRLYAETSFESAARLRKSLQFPEVKTVELYSLNAASLAPRTITRLIDVQFSITTIQRLLDSLCELFGLIVIQALRQVADVRCNAGQVKFQCMHLLLKKVDFLSFRRPRIETL